MSAGVAGKRRGAGQQNIGGLREMEGEDWRTKLVSAGKKLRRGQLEKDLLMITLIKYKVWVSSLREKLEVEDLNERALLRELGRVKEDIEALDSESALLLCITEDGLHDAAYGRGCSIWFEPRLVKELELKYGGVAMSVGREFRSRFSQEVSDPGCFKQKNVELVSALLMALPRSRKD